MLWAETTESSHNVDSIKPVIYFHMDPPAESDSKKLTDSSLYLLYVNHES